jgi:hypothetical protein
MRTMERMMENMEKKKKVITLELLAVCLPKSKRSIF